MKKLSGLALFLITALLLTVGIVLYARGYRPNIKEKTLDPTGIVSIKSQPSDAEVFINGEEKGTTDLDIPNLSPGKYTIKITKEGFSSWGKEIEVKKERVNLLEVVLFPLAPSLKALTFNGGSEPIASPDGKRIVFAIKEPQDKSGLWSLDLTSGPLTIPFFSKDLTKLVSDTKEIAFSSSTYEFSPDGKQLLLQMSGQYMFFLLDTTKENKDPKEVTLDLDKTKKAWTKKRTSDTNNALKALGKEAQSAATGLTNITFSPDKTKFIGSRADGSALVLDSQAQVNGDERTKLVDLPKADRYLWYPNNQCILLVSNNAISIVEVDGTNNAPIYTGNFDPNLVVPWPDGSKIVITTNLNAAASGLPNLYAIELR
ncbi:MAG: hypothetical protein A2Z24_01975 [Candidatus Woykebacteria bacterium RBG_16_44_10]|uniref:PEGA domain-containing protein n=1 Tax=Candidatus Woykebacteria bacterium RBG_16_44_10 TaxID=1802597 RepID=A0A1G1WCP2_9BACT|nr:MAG: hypothetical protein A2Z24_01975 [Candidatus Woykebacteria bacterium RBG_16_44_10]